MTLFDWHGRPGHLSQAQEAGLTRHLGARLYRDTGEVAAHINAGRYKRSFACVLGSFVYHEKCRPAGRAAVLR
jgi:hypothetical protein